MLLNHSKFRELMSLEDRRAKAAERQRRFKERRRSGNAQGNAGSRSVTESNAGNDIRSDQNISEQITEKAIAQPPVERASFDLEAIYAKYPRKIGKAKGMAKLTVAIKTQEQYAAVVAGVERFAAQVKRKGTEPGFVPHFSSWVNSRRWEDEDDPASPPRQVNGNARLPPRPIDAIPEEDGGEQELIV